MIQYIWFLGVSYTLFVPRLFGDSWGIFFAFTVLLMLTKWSIITSVKIILKGKNL